MRPPRPRRGWSCRGSRVPGWASGPYGPGAGHRGAGGGERRGADGESDEGDLPREEDPRLHTELPRLTLLVVDRSDLHFVFVGDGAGRKVLLAEAQKRRLKYVQFLPFQPRDRFAEVLATADVSLVILRKGYILER